MMNYFIEVDTSSGEVLQAMYTREQAALLSIQETSTLYKVEESSYKTAIKGASFYELGEVHLVPEPPKKGHTFNFITRSWEDLRPLQQVKDAKWEDLKAERDALEFGGFNYLGMVFDSDQVSQGRIMGAAVAGIDRTWTLADNTTVELSTSQLQQLYVTLQLHIASVHERGRIARQLIFDAETKEEVEAIQL